MRCDDSEAVYVEGQLRLEGFVLEPQAVLAAAHLDSDTGEADEDWFEEQGRAFPVSLGDVVWTRNRR